MRDWADRLLDPRAERPALEPGTALRYQVERDGRLVDVRVTLQRYPLASTLVRNANTVLFVLMLLALAIYVFAHRPHDPAARVLLVLACLAVWGASWWTGPPLGVVDLVAATGFWRYVAGEISDAFVWAALLHCVLVFPRPRPVLIRRPWLAGLVYVLPFALHGAWLAVAVALAAPADAVARARLMASPVMLTNLVYPVAVIAALIHGYRSMRDAADRQRLRWVAVTLGAGLGLYLMIWHVPAIVVRRPLLPAELRFIVFVPTPFMVAAAILRYQAFEIKVVINRALVYVLLTIGVLGIYLGAVWLLGTLFQRRAALSVPSLIATGLAAALFGPLRERLQRWVSRLLYGERDEPYRAISRLGQRLESTQAPAAVLPTVVETVAQALRLPYTSIELKRGDAFEQAAVHGEPAGELLELPLRYQGEVIGRLMLSPRGPVEGFSPGDRRLLEDLARQAGVAVHAVRLTEDLQVQLEEVRAGRARIAEAILDERRKLARDLHDGAQPRLLSVSMRMQAARAELTTIAAHDDGVLAELLEAAGSDARAAVKEVRDLAHGIHPAVLTERGLAAALQDLTERIDLPVTIDVPTIRWPSPVEATAYFVVSEALTNVVKHADAGRATITAAARNGCLTVEVADDGAGDADPERGTGLRNLADRVAAIGGGLTVDSVPGQGTRVVVELPCA